MKADLKLYQDPIDVFLAGVIQGSKIAEEIEEQSYRDRLLELFAAKLPEVKAYCPFSHHSTSINYTDEEGEAVFLHHLQMVRDSKLLVAYLPEASLGTAIEIWEARDAGVPIVAISPMKHNWVLRFFTARIFPDLDAFESWLTPENYRAITTRE